jgi:hypothetical protein
MDSMIDAVAGDKIPVPDLAWAECLHYRDRFRTARYLALADAEGFGEICFAVEALGLRLRGQEATMGKYVVQIRPFASKSPGLSLARDFPMLLTRFDALYETVQRARNDAMHTGVYARYATTAAIELCIGLEEALMGDTQFSRQTVADYMVKAPVIVEPWQPVAHARQLMLTHSFSFLPVHIDKWKLVPELSMARYLHRDPDRRKLLATRIDNAARHGLDLLDVIVQPSDNVTDLLKDADVAKSQLWLVQGPNGDLCGVLSPFELM